MLNVLSQTGNARGSDGGLAAHANIINLHWTSRTMGNIILYIYMNIYIIFLAMQIVTFAFQNEISLKASGGYSV